MSVSGRRNKRRIIAEAKGTHPYFDIGELLSFTYPLDGSKIVLEVADASQFPKGFECDVCKLNSLCRNRENIALDTIPMCIAGIRADKKSVYFKEA